MSIFAAATIFCRYYRFAACNDFFVLLHTKIFAACDDFLWGRLAACGGFSIRLVRFPASNWLRLCCPAGQVSTCGGFSIRLGDRVGQIGNLRPIGNRPRPLTRNPLCGAGLQPAADFQSAWSAFRHPIGCGLPRFNTRIRQREAGASATEHSTVRAGMFRQSTSSEPYTAKRRQAPLAIIPRGDPLPIATISLLLAMAYSATAYSRGARLRRQSPRRLPMPAARCRQ